MSTEDILSKFRDTVDTIVNSSNLQAIVRRQAVANSLAYGAPTAAPVTPRYVPDPGVAGGGPVGAGEFIGDIMTNVSRLPSGSPGESVAPPDWGSIYGQRAQKQLEEKKMMDAREVEEASAIQESQAAEQQQRGALAGASIDAIMQEGQLQAATQQSQQTLEMEMFRTLTGSEDLRLKRIAKETDASEETLKAAVKYVDNLTSNPNQRQEIRKEVARALEAADVSPSDLSYEEWTQLIDDAVESLKSGPVVEDSLGGLQRTTTVDGVPVPEAPEEAPASMSDFELQGTTQAPQRRIVSGYDEAGAPQKFYEDTGEVVPGTTGVAPERPLTTEEEAEKAGALEAARQAAAAPYRESPEEKESRERRSFEWKESLKYKNAQKKSIQSFDATLNALEELRTLVTDYGTEQMPGEIKGRMGAAHKLALFEMKDMYKLGALDQGVIDVFNDMVADPTKWTTQLKSTVLGGLDQTAELIRAKRAIAMDAGKGDSPSAPAKRKRGGRNLFDAGY